MLLVKLPVLHNVNGAESQIYFNVDLIESFGSRYEGMVLDPDRTIISFPTQASVINLPIERVLTEIAKVKSGRSVVDLDPSSTSSHVNPPAAPFNPMITHAYDMVCTNCCWPYKTTTCGKKASYMTCPYCNHINSF